MPYSQKYTLVQFLEPVKVGYVFTTEEWPPHITLVDVFGVELKQKVLDELEKIIGSESSFVVHAGEQSKLGSGINAVQVILIDKTSEIQSLHNRLIDFLELKDAEFNSPEFTRKGFLPHSTYKNQANVKQGEQIDIDELSIIDMFVDGNWRLRKILKSFKLYS